MVSASMMTRASSESSSPDSAQRFDQVLDRVPFTLLHGVEPLEDPGSSLAGERRRFGPCNCRRSPRRRKTTTGNSSPGSFGPCRDARFLVVRGDHDQEPRTGIFAAASRRPVAIAASAVASRKTK